MTLNHFFSFFLDIRRTSFFLKKGLSDFFFYLMVIAISLRGFVNNLNDSSFFFFFVCLIMVGFFTKVLNIIL